MLKSRCCLLFLLLSSLQAAAQHPDDEYYPYAEREERREVLTTDSAIFYRAVQGVSDLYGDHTDFNLPQVARKRRGLGYRAMRTSLSGVDLPYRACWGPKRNVMRGLLLRPASGALSAG